ncbi:MAG: response regulator transcription factor [Deltaproteobacteria bacterium]|nr:response regulator transcription factor [Deltaproteobacteria bacterium]
MRADRRGRILVVDDHDAARRSLARVLGSVCDVVVAPSCEQALETLEDTKRPFDLVLLDPAFPEDQIHGAAALAQIGSRWPDLAIIVVSTLPELGAVARLTQAGAADYLTKEPETMGVLWLRVRHHVERVRLRRENRELRAQVNRVQPRSSPTLRIPSGYATSKTAASQCNCPELCGIQDSLTWLDLHPGQSAARPG